MMKGSKRTANLYVLPSTTVMGDVFIAFISMLYDDVTKLWHIRFSHMSENDLIN